MVSLLVFATCDIKPDEWADFARALTLKDTDIKPYVLVTSDSPEDFKSRTNSLDSSANTQLGSATYSQLRGLFRKLVDQEDPAPLSIDQFMILEEQSISARNVVIYHREEEWVHPDGTRFPCDLTELGRDVHGRDDEDQFAPKIVWRRYRVPYEKAEFHWLVLESKGGSRCDNVEDYRKFLEDVEIAPIEEKAFKYK
ncbi:MAG: hypothetical protein M1820_009416 [Bogoriella megaspora]|nr:MAG: hypothetical protein M1820_009416 [Bogoriella megaspora]